jgi:RNA polymerase sigma-70 factor, ECF subfamily
METLPKRQTMQTGDPKLWEDVQREGSEHAFALLFDRHSEAIFRFAAHALGDRNAAEDVVSMTFLTLWRRRRSLQVSPDRSLRSLLIGISANIIRNERRSRLRYHRALRRIRHEIGEDDFSRQVDSRLDGASELAATRSLMRELSHGERIVFLVHHVAGLSHQETAEATGVPVGTVKSRLSRAHTKLAARLKQEVPGDDADR